VHLNISFYDGKKDVLDKDDCTTIESCWGFIFSIVYGRLRFPSHLTCGSPKISSMRSLWGGDKEDMVKYLRLYNESNVCKDKFVLMDLKVNKKLV